MSNLKFYEKVTHKMVEWITYQFFCEVSKRFCLNKICSLHILRNISSGKKMRKFERENVEMTFRVLLHKTGWKIFPLFRLRWSSFLLRPSKSTTWKPKQRRTAARMPVESNLSQPLIGITRALLECCLHTCCYFRWHRTLWKRNSP